MIEIPRILCAIDFSDISARALKYAAASARWYESKLTVLHVVPVVTPVAALPPLATLPPGAPPLDEAARARLTDDTARFVQDTIGTDLPVDIRVVDAPWPHREIVEQAISDDVSLVIVGTHGRSGYQRLFLGSVAERVLRTSPIPVMVVPPGPEEPVPAGDVGFDQILCGVDFSDASLNAAAYAMSFATEADAHLALVVVEEPFPQPAELWDATGAAVEQMRAAGRAAALKRLEGMVPDDVRTFSKVETMVVEGKPYREILRLAAERKSDLIVIGSRGHGALGHLFFGSNAGHIVRNAPCPVLAVPPGRIGS